MSEIAIVTAEVYNLFKKAGLITNDGQFDDGTALFTGLHGREIPVHHRNKHQMEYPVKMYIKDVEELA